MFYFVAVFLSVLLIGAGFANADSESDGYSGEVMELFKDLTQYKSNVQIAKTKMNSFPYETWDRKYAIAMINLYTQASSFYLTVNAKMRTGYPNDSKNIWRRAGDLINRGLDVLGPTLHKKVYRGCKKLDNKPVAGQQYVFNHITSTSTDRATSVGFISCKNGMLFDIENVYGVSVEKYSYFKFEREVIIRSTTKFRVKSVTENVGTYSIYYLDGQPGVNNVYSTSTTTTSSTSTGTTAPDEELAENINSGNKHDTGSGLKHVFAVVILLTYYGLF